MENIKLRKATEEDMHAILELIKELAAYENAPEEVTVTLNDLKRDGFEKNLFSCIVADEEKEILGMALFYPRYSTWKGRTIHLEDFIVRQSDRRRGIGKMLFNAVVKEAQIFGAKRLEWAVLNWNKPAIDFYNKIDAEYDKDWLIAQLREKQIVEYNFE